MKKISRRSFITAMAAVSAAGVLAACGSSSSSTASSAVSSEATSSAASMDETGTHTVVDHGGNEVEVPNKVTRVVIDQIPILSTYMAYFEGSAPYIVGYCGSFKSVISDTVLKNIAPELLESSDTVYAQSDLNIEEIWVVRETASFFWESMGRKCLSNPEKCCMYRRKHCAAQKPTVE